MKAAKTTAVVVARCSRTKPEPGTTKPWSVDRGDKVPSRGRTDDDVLNRLYGDFPTTAHGTESQARRPAFGIRLDRRVPQAWAATATYKLSDESALAQIAAPEDVAGTFDFGAYAGYPHCLNPTIVKCSCGGVGCWDSVRKLYTCPWCGQKAPVQGAFESLPTGQER
jgi:hypothetical protein